MQKAFHLELERCTGCKACEIACEIENELPEGMQWRRVRTFNEVHEPGVPQFHLSLACNHCLDAPCEKNCPALAYDKDPTTGAVTIDPRLCIGCKYCSWACPYDAPRFSASEGVMQKCTFCSHRLADALEPACTTSCPTGALSFGEFSIGTASTAIPGFYRESIEPALVIQPFRGAAPTVDEPASRIVNTSVEPKVSLRSEWSLLLFTWMAPIVVALETMVTAPFWLGPTLALIAMALSAGHLGKPERAYRAMLNWRRSWLSREVLLFSTFVALSVVPGTRIAALLFGFAALFAMDQVYQLPTNRRRGGLGHVSVLLTGVFLTGVFNGWLWLWLPTALVKLGHYLGRRRESSGLGPAWAVARVLVGFVVPIAAIPSYALAVACVLLGELIDRAEFYEALDFVQPSTQMDRDLAYWSSASESG